jgi:hypothetical protein
MTLAATLTINLRSFNDYLLFTLADILYLDGYNQKYIKLTIRGGVSAFSLITLVAGPSTADYEFVRRIKA